jgi:subtilisin family serine protease
MPMRMAPRYPAAFPEVISVGAVDKSDNPALYSDYPSLPPHHNGIATYGGGFPMAVTASLDADPNDETPVEPALPIDALRGVFSSPVFPALSANEQGKSYEPPTRSAWAYWPGTSFATPIVSAVAARVLEQIKSSDMCVPSNLLPAHVQWAITTAKGQEAMLTGNSPLPSQPVFGVSTLKAVQTCKEYKRK